MEPVDSSPPTVRTPPMLEGSDQVEREAFGLDAIRRENGRLKAFGLELLIEGGFEITEGDILDVDVEV